MSATGAVTLALTSISFSCQTKDAEAIGVVGSFVTILLLRVPSVHDYESVSCFREEDKELNNVKKKKERKMSESESKSETPGSMYSWRVMALDVWLCTKSKGGREPVTMQM